MKNQPDNIEKLSNIHYKGSWGYYIYEDYQWVFIPFEKSICIDKLKSILDTLQNLNDNTKHNR